MSGSARVHRTEVEARHGHRARGGEGASARRRAVLLSRGHWTVLRWAI
jgi:hypothetical protein